MASIAFSTPLDQYAITIPGKGFITANVGNTIAITHDEELAAYDDLSYVKTLLNTVRGAYRRLGAEEIGNTAIIVRREITLTHGVWHSISNDT